MNHAPPFTMRQVDHGPIGGICAEVLATFET